MATTKTLTPTNQTITIDAFQGEKPDHRHVADAETKLADAVNALNSKITPSSVGSPTAGTGITNTDLTVYKSGGMCVLNGSVAISGTFAGSGGVLATLPDNFKPKETLSIYAFSKYGTNDMAMNRMRITSAGEIQTYTGGYTFSGSIFFNCSYPAS